MDEFNPVIGVTGLNATDNPGPGISVIRSLRAHLDFRGRIVGLAYNSLDPGLYASDLIDSAYLLPFPAEGIDSLRHRIRYIKEKADVSVVIPTLDSELPGFIALEPELKQMGIGLFLPTKDQYETRSKIRLSEVGHKADLDVPRTRVISEADPLYRLGKEIPFPWVVKGVFYGAFVVRTLDEAVSAFYRTAALWGYPVIIQEFHEGEEFDVVAVGDGKGGVVGAIPIKKTFLTDKGKGWAGVSIKDPKLMEITEKFCRATKWRGPCEIEVIKTNQDKYYLLEINPRFPAWTYLCAGAGQNLPFAVAQLALGIDPMPLADYKVGIMFVRISMEQIVGINALEDIISKGEIHYKN
jgi:carbamoyl-phosphate synthase large subunit